VYHNVDNLYRLGANVLYSRIANVHVRGHAAREELKIVQALVRPKFFVPVHGEYRHLYQHAQLARSMGVEEDNAIIMVDGDVLEVDEHSAAIVDKIPADYVYVDGLGVGDVDHVVLRDRQHLSTDGVVVVVLAVDKDTGKVVGRPDVITRGLTSLDESDELRESARDVVVESLQEGEEHPADWLTIHQKVREAVAKFFYEETHRRPLVLPVAVEV
jgi:ribonuclease J